MPGLVPGIHVLTASQRSKTWMAVINPAMMAQNVFIEHETL
jgi:hypothetical protein